jgi:hypothetical protein
VSTETATINGGAAVLAEDPYRAVAEHLLDAAVVLFDRDLRVRLATGTTLPGPAWSSDHYPCPPARPRRPVRASSSRRPGWPRYRDGPEVILLVQADAGGFDPTRIQALADIHGFGLTCMRERLQAIGGRFTLRSAPGAGPRIRAQAAARAPA